MNNAQCFLETMQSIDPNIIDMVDAIFEARRMVPKIDHDTYHGEVITKTGDVAGIFRSNDQESRWFPNMSLKMVAYIIGEETL